MSESEKLERKNGEIVTASSSSSSELMDCQAVSSCLQLRQATAAAAAAGVPVASGALSAS